MKGKVVTILLAALLMTAFVFAQSSTAKLIEEKVYALNRAIFIEKDSATLAKLISNDVTYGHSNANIEDKSTMITKTLANLSVYTDVSTTIGTIQVIKNTVIARHVLSATETNKEGKVSPLKLSVLQVWIKESGVWKLRARQSAKIISN